MPSWKKVIVSGSDAALNSLLVTNGITGSLLGTAATASFVTGSNVYGPYGSNSVISSSYAAFALTASNSQNAQDILIYVKNVTGAQINKGKVVRISGATGDNALISTASYESDGLSANTLGITYQDIPNDSFGYVITEGTLLGINTNAFSAGQLLYLGATGSIIGTAPVAPLHAVRLGQVLRVQTNNGSMYVRIDNGYELGELHDVVDTTTNSSYGDLLVKSGSVWINSRQLTGSYGVTGSLNLNGTALITGSLTVGATSVGASENTITLGARDTANEGGQIGFNAPGGTYTSASFIDNWQNKHRILKGNNTTSTGLIAQWDIHTTQMQLPSYTSTSAFPGTAAANLAVDSSGNVITVSTSGGTVFPYTGNAVITGSLTTTGIIYAQPNGGKYFQGGDDAGLYDINVVNTMGIYGEQTVTEGAVKLGSNGPVLYGSGSRLGIGTTTPTLGTLQVNGNVWATSFTGSLQGTASFATSASVATSAPLYLPLAGGTLTGNLSAAGRTFTFQDLVLGSGTTFGTIKTDGTKYIGMYPTNGTESTRFLANGNVMHGTTFTDAGYRLQVSASTAVSGALQVIGTAVFTGSVLINGSLNATSLTGSLQGTASFATTSLSSSYALTAATASNGSNTFTIGSNKIFSQYNSGGTANDALKLSTTNLGAVFGVQNTNASGFSGIEYIDNANAVKVFTGYNNSGTGEFRFNNIASNGFITFKIGSADKLTIANSGNVGIDTANPNAKLDVNGNAIITGSLTVTGRITAEEFHTEFVSASIVYQSGSTKFGNSSDDVMSVTGSLRVNGSITGSLFGTASFATTASYVNPLNQNVIVTGNFNSLGTGVIGTDISLPNYTINDGVSSMMSFTQIDTWPAYTVTGEILWKETFNDTVIKGQLVTKTAAGWVLADNRVGTGIFSYMLGIALTNAGPSDIGGVLLKGIVTSEYNVDQSSAASGTPVYMDGSIDNGAGYMVSTAPSSTGRTVRIVGYTYINSSNQSASQYVLRFDPSSTWLEL